MGNKLSKRTCFLLILSLTCLVGISLLYNWNQRRLWKEEQGNINLTSDQILNIFANSEYEVSNIRHIEKWESSMNFKKGDTCFDIDYYGTIYKVCVKNIDGWELAMKASESANDLDIRMGGGQSYHFSYGSSLIGVIPPIPPEEEERPGAYRKLGIGLIRTLEKERKKMNE